MMNFQDSYGYKALLSKDKHERYAFRNIFHIVKKSEKLLVNKNPANATRATISVEDVKMY